MTTDTSDFRLLHTMIRVKDAAKSIDFYSRHLGMKVLRNKIFRREVHQYIHGIW